MESGNNSFSPEWRVPFVGLRRQYKALREEILECVDRIFSQAAFIMRGDVAEFEEAAAAYLGVDHVIGVNSGTDALFLALKALDLGPEDEVITVPYTFIATVAAIVHCGAKPVLVDIGADFNMAAENIVKAVTPRTRAIIPVHLNGRTCDMNAIMDVAGRHSLSVVEDAAQSFGARYNGRCAGSIGAAGCFSLHPMKNLNVGGDGGLISTNDGALADKLRILRNVGQRTKEEIACFGYNSRLDTLHAAVALIKLKYFPEWIERYRRLAQRYDEALSGIEGLTLPPPPSDGIHFDVFSSYILRTPRRDALKAHLLADGIEAFVHWPTPLHRQPALNLGGHNFPQADRIAGETLSLPIYPQLTDGEQDIVIDSTRRFFTRM